MYLLDAPLGILVIRSLLSIHVLKRAEGAQPVFCAVFAMLFRV